MRGSIYIISSLLLLPAVVQAERVVVFQVQDQTRRVRARDLRSMRDMLADKLSQSPALTAVGRAPLRKVMTGKRRRCKDLKCMRAVAEQLSATRFVATQLVKLGNRCVVMSRLYATGEAGLLRSASERSACNAAGLSAAVGAAAEFLTTGLAAPAPRPAAVTAARSNSAGFDEPGLRHSGVGVMPAASGPARAPFPLWPALVAAGVGVVGLGVGIPSIALDGDGHDCDGDPRDDTTNCKQLWNTGGMGWVFTGLAVGALATSGVLYYLHASSTPRERRSASIDIISVGPTPNGGLVVGTAGRF